MLMRIVSTGEASSSTRVFSQDGTEIGDVMEIRLSPLVGGALTTAAILVYGVELDLQVDGTIWPDLETLERSAAFHGFTLVPMAKTAK